MLLSMEQSLPICCSLAVIGGVLEVGATAVTAIPAVREQEGKKLSPMLYWLALAGNVSLQLMGSLTSHLVATWFGPVSIVVPFFYAATLLSNMLIFGAMLGLEFFTKNMQVGTYVIVCAVILLPVVGPTIQEDQDISLLFKHWYSSVWFSMLLVAMLITGALLTQDLTRYSMRGRTAILLIARASSITVNLTVSRSFILSPPHAVFVLFIIFKIVSGGIYTSAIVVQSTAVDQARFVPLNTTTIIVVNAITGIIIWEDWKVMQSWYGYACVFCLLGLGIDLLLSVPLLTEDNPMFGANKRASMILRRDEGYRHIPDVNTEEAPAASTEEMGAESKEVQEESPTMTRREAWKVITGFHPTSTTTRNVGSAMTNLVDRSVHVVRESAPVSSFQPLDAGKRMVTAPVNAGKQALKAAADLTGQGKDSMMAYFTRKR